MHTLFSARIAPLRVLRLPQVCNMTGLGKTMIYLLQSERQFPQRIKLSTRAVGWLEGEVQEWLMKRVEARRLSGAVTLPRIRAHRALKRAAAE